MSYFKMRLFRKCTMFNTTTEERYVILALQSANNVPSPGARTRAHQTPFKKKCKTQKSLLMETKSTNISDTCYFKSYCVRCLFDWWPFIHTSPTIGWVFHFMMYILWSELFFFFLFLLHVKGDSLTVARNCIPRANKKHAPRNKWQKSLPAFRHR